MAAAGAGAVPAAVAAVRTSRAGRGIAGGDIGGRVDAPPVEAVDPLKDIDILLPSEGNNRPGAWAFETSAGAGTRSPFFRAARPS